VVIVHFLRVAAISEDVLVAALRPRKLAWLANGNEAGAENARDATSENESARLDAGDRGDLVLEKRFGESLYAFIERFGCAKQRRDVLEHDAGLRKIGNVANVALQIHQNFTSKSASLPVNSFVS